MAAARPKPSRSLLTHIHMCESCARRCWGALQRPAMVERVLLQEVAAVLESCKTCVSQAGKLKNAAQKSVGDQLWAWVEGI
jgi:hypothetical protein